jgi:cell division protein FtsA
MSKNIGVLDIGSGFLKILVFNIEDETPDFLYYQKVPSKGIERGTIVRGSSAIRSLKELLKKINSFDITIDELYVLISHPKVSFTNEKVEYQDEEKTIAPAPEEKFEDERNLIEIEPFHLDKLKEKVAKKVKDKNSVIIHIIPRYFLLDGDIYYEPIGLTASKLEAEYHVVKIPKQIYLNISRLLRKVGFNVERIFFPPYVASYDLFNEEDIEKNILILDFGHTTTGFTYFKEGSPLISGVIPKGGKDITELIANTYFLSLNEAERIKRDVGYIPNFEEELQSEEPKEIAVRNKDGNVIRIKEAEVSYIIREGLLNIIEPLLIQLFEKHKLNWEKEIDEIILIGGGAQLKGIKEFFEEIKRELGVPWNIRLGFSSQMGDFYGVEPLEENFSQNMESEEENKTFKSEEKENLITLPEFAALRGVAWFLTKINVQNQSLDSEQNPLSLKEKEEPPSFPEATSVSLEQENLQKKKEGFLQKITQFIKRVFSED